MLCMRASERETLARGLPETEGVREPGCGSVMRVLHVLDHSLPVHSGYTFRTRAILEQQRARGWETVQVTSPKHPEYRGPEETVEGFHFYRTAANGYLGRLPVLAQLGVVTALERRLLEVARATAPDVLHAHSPCLNGLAALRAGRRLGIPVVYEVRAFWEDAAVDHGTTRENGARYRLTRTLETRVLRRADAVTTICEGLKADIVARGIDPARVTVIPNAVDADRFRSGGEPNAGLRARLGLEGKRVVGFIGSFYAYEGLALLVEALPRILAQGSDVRVLLVGGGPQAERLAALARERGVAGEVLFTGRVPHDAVPAYYDLVDVLVYPRLSMRLTELVTPLKPLEAMAQGRLVAASDVGGHRELIRDGETGVIFPAGDPEALAQAVITLLRSQSRWPELRAAARRFVERERTWQASTARYETVYEAARGRGSCASTRCA